MTRTLAFVRPSLHPHPLRAALAGSLGAVADAAPPADAGAEIRLFLTMWLGGLVFFGTYLA